MAMKQGELVPALVPQVCNHPEFGEVRVVDNNGDPWFVGRDVAEKLGYANPNDALAKHVDSEDKLVSQIAIAGQRRNVTLINEGGLYSLTVRSNMPNAKKFTRWLTHDVAISIRKHGVYATDDFLNKTLADPDWAIGILTELKATREKNAALENQVAELKPKADYCERILQSKEALTVTVIAKDYGMGGAQFNDLLAKLKVQYKVGKTWVLYQNYANAGYTVTETKLLPNGLTVTITRWSQKGRMFLYQKLKGIGIVPVVERTEPMATLPGLVSKP